MGGTVKLGIVHLAKVSLLLTSLETQRLVSKTTAVNGTTPLHTLPQWHRLKRLRLQDKCLEVLQILPLFSTFIDTQTVFMFQPVRP